MGWERWEWGERDGRGYGGRSCILFVVELIGKGYISDKK